MHSRLSNSILAFILCFSITGLAQIVVGPGSGGSGGSGSVAWGSITGTLSDQTDLQSALDAKQDTITFGTGVETALGINIGSAGAPVLFNGALGTPSSGTLTNATGLPIAGITGLGANVGTWLATPSSANLASAVTGETGSGALVFGTAPTITIGSTNQVIFHNGTALTGSASFLWDETNEDLTIVPNEMFGGGGIVVDASASANTSAGATLSIQSGNNAAFGIRLNGNGFWALGVEGGLNFGIKNAQVGDFPISIASSDSDITFAGSSENISTSFSSNTWTWSTSTGVTKIDFGTIILEGAFSSSDGSAGVTVTTCTSFKDGLCVAGT